MEKYLIILIITIICYYVFRYCVQLEVEKIIKTKEGFANTSDSDLINSITTLGQIATDLQKDGVKVPGNLNVIGTINTDNDITAKAITAKGAINASSLSVGSGQINGGTIISSNLVASGRNILDELNSLRTGLKTVSSDFANYKGGMRLFTMITNGFEPKEIKDGSLTFSVNDWVCCVQGVRVSWGEGEPKSVETLCYKQGNTWWVKTLSRNTWRGRHGDQEIEGAPIILAIPIRYFAQVGIISHGQNLKT